MYVCLFSIDAYMHAYPAEPFGVGSHPGKGTRTTGTGWQIQHEM